MGDRGGSKDKGKKEKQEKGEANAKGKTKSSKGQEKQIEFRLRFLIDSRDQFQANSDRNLQYCPESSLKDPNWLVASESH